MIRFPGFVHENRGRSSHVVDDYIDVTVIVEISESHTAARLRHTVVESSGAADFFEGPVPAVVKELNGLAVGKFVWKSFENGRNISISDKNIGPAIVVEVRESNSPTHGRIS